MADPIEKLKKVVDKQEKLLQELQWKKYHNLIDIALRVVRKHNVLLYGGAAINSLLPKKYKFYDEHELIDIDIFCTNKTNILHDLRKEYTKNGYKLINIYEALNPDTTKVQVEGVGVLDIHKVSHHLYDLMSVDSKVGDLGIRCGSIMYLRNTLYKQLSEPLSAYRWVKIFKRLVVFNKVFPVKAPCRLPVPGKEDPVIETAQKQIYEYIKKTHYLIIAADIMLLEGLHKKIAGDRIDIIVEEPVKDVAKEIMEKLPNLHLEIVATAKNDAFDFTPESITLAFNKVPILKIYHTGGFCLSYVLYRGARLASLPTTIRYHLSQLITKEETNDCIVNLLIALQMKALSSKSLKNRVLFNQFITDCYGAEIGFFTRKRERLGRILGKK
jgi:hypothetical protein